MLIHCQSIPLKASYAASPACQKRKKKKAVGHPRLKTIMRGGGGTKPSGRERIPLAARSQHKEDSLGAHPIRHAWAATAKAVGVLVRGQERLDQRPKLVG
jgi:hypothetical protein